MTKSNIVLLIFLVLFGVATIGTVAVGILDSDDQAKQDRANTEVVKQIQEQQKKQEEIEKVNQDRTLTNFTPVAAVQSLQKIDISEGTGAEVKPGATVDAHYTGAVAATGKVFQSSRDFGDKPITFGLNGVIRGWTEGVPGMKVGGKRRLVIPATQAYGANPPAGSGIPANADLVFDIEILGVK